MPRADVVTLSEMLARVDHLVLRWSKFHGSMTAYCIGPLVQARAKRLKGERLEDMLTRGLARLFERQRTGERPARRPTRRCRVCGSSRNIRTHNQVMLCSAHDLTRHGADDAR